MNNECFKPNLPRGCQELLTLEQWCLVGGFAVICIVLLIKITDWKRQDDADDAD